jgi:hypothetical protein
MNWKIASPRCSTNFRVTVAVAIFFSLTYGAVSKQAGDPLQTIGASALPAQSADSFAVELLRGEIQSLSPAVRADEARKLAQSAHAASRQLAREYQVLGPPLFHNFLVNTGLRKRGLCFHWARDLLVRLDRLKLKTLELHWGGARAGTLREHNCVVVTAKGQPFEQGIVLDCWRHSGRLFFSRIATDHYPWIEDKAEYARVTKTAPAIAVANTTLKQDKPASSAESKLVNSATAISGRSKDKSRLTQ